MKVLFLILKIAGISVLMVLLLLIFLLLLLLCLPFYYRIDANIPENLSRAEALKQTQVKVSVRFLGVAIAMIWEYCHGKSNLSFRVFGFPIGRRRHKKKHGRKKEGNTKRVHKKKTKLVQDRQKPEFIPTDDTERIESIQTVQDDDTKETESAQQDDGAEKYTEETEEKEKQPDMSRFRIKSFLEKWEHMLQDIKNGKENIKEKKKKFSDIWSDIRIRNALSVVWEQFGFLCMVLKPKKITGRIHFGFADPALTGQFLGILSILYTWAFADYTDTLHIVPEFYRQTLDLELKAVGKIRFFSLFKVFWRLYRNKEVKYAYGKFRF